MPKRNGSQPLLYLRYKEGDAWRKVKRATSAKDESGKKKSKKTLEDELAAWQRAMEAEAALEAERKANPAHFLTVREYVEGYIAENAQSVTPATTTGYKKLLNGLISPSIGDIELEELKPSDVAAWLTSERESGKYSAVTLRKAFMLLKSAMKQAVERDVLSKDPMRTVKAPKADEGKPNALDERGRGMVASFVDIQPADSVSIAIRLALFTGMRQGEVCGLRWRNVDTAARTLTVCESIGRASKADLKGNGTNLDFSGLYIKAPKTKKSIRTIAYPESVARALMARRAEAEAECMAAGVPFSGELFVCGTPDGNPMHPQQLFRRWTATAEALGLVGTQGNRPTFHDLRHTYATTAISHGIDVKTVSESMGHTNAAMTLNRYADVDPDARRRASDTVDRAYAAEKRAVRDSAMGEVLTLDRTGTEG